MSKSSNILKESAKAKEVEKKSPFSAEPLTAETDTEIVLSPIDKGVGALESKRASHTSFSGDKSTTEQKGVDVSAVPRDAKTDSESKKTESPFQVLNEEESDQISVLPMPVKDEKGFSPTTDFKVIPDQNSQKEPIYAFGSSKSQTDTSEDDVSKNNQAVANTRNKEVNTTQDSSKLDDKNKSDDPALSGKTSPSGPPKPPPGAKAVVLPATPDITRPFMDDDETEKSPLNSAGTLTAARSAAPSARDRKKSSKSQDSKSKGEDSPSKDSSKEKSKTSSTPPWSTPTLAPWTPPSEAKSSEPEPAKEAKSVFASVPENSTPAETKPAATQSEAKSQPATSGSDQLVLRALFGVTKNLTRSEVIDLGTNLPGIKKLDVLSGEQAKALEALQKSIEKLGYTDLGGLGLTSTSEAIDFVELGGTTLIVQNEGEYQPGVREKLMIIAQELSKL